MYFQDYDYIPQHQYPSVTTYQNQQQFSMIDNLYEKLTSKKILIGSTDLLKAVDNDSFLNLWNKLWKENAEIIRQGNFLELIVSAISDRHPQIYYSTQNFISKVLKIGLIEKIVYKLVVTVSQGDPSNLLYIKMLNNLIKILIAAFELVPTQIEYNILICVNNVLKNVAPVSSETRALLEMLEEQVLTYQKAEEEEKENPGQQNNQKNRHLSSFLPSHGKPADDFRSLSIIPRATELVPGYQPFIRSAIIKGSYSSDTDYLDTQFRLMREDLVQKFREGITTHESNNDDIYIHRDVTLDSSTLHYPTGDYIHYANIKASKQIINNKTMKYQSLICLSSDNFKKDFLFATVIDRDEKHIKEGKVGLKFEGNMFEININVEYSMIESSAFFEAYRHVLTTLQGFNPEYPIPFSKYFVKLNTKTETPAYLKNQNDFDFSPVLTEEAKAQLSSSKFRFSELSKLKCEKFGMNESQFEAFKYALTSDLAVIQGPPGTGKSYIGAEIAKFLLNKNNWKAINPDKNDERPLLVVCYTNHALDQFLTQIAGFVNENDIVRVGSRCKNPLVQRFMLHKKRHEMSEARISYNNLKNKIDPLLYEISKNLEYLIQLENRLASKEALCLSENYNRIANNILFSKLSTDDDIVKWLITYKETIENEYFFDIDIIRKLVGWEIAEIKAKNIYAHVCKNNMKMDAATMYQKFKSSKTLPSHLENEKSKNWPKLAHIDELKELGYPEKLAIEILASAKNNIQLILLEHKSIMAVKKFEESYFVEIFKVKLKLVEEYLKNKNITKETESLENFDITEKQNEEIELQTDREWQYPKELEPYHHIILQALPMKDNDAYAENDIWKLSLLSRWSLYQYWISESQKARKREISAAEKQYRHNVKLLNEQKTVVDGEIMKYAKVIGMTTTGAAKLQSTLRSIKPRIVMAEEAAEVFEAHIVTSLTEACEHLILIGDHKQLRPNPAVYELAKKFNMDVSLFERLIKNKFPFKMLNFQWRMRPEISMLMKNHFYENLHDHDMVKNYPHVYGVTKDLYFITHTYSETTNKQDGSHKNEYEIYYALKLAKYFLQQGYDKNQITILCTYSDQCFGMKDVEEKILGNKNGIQIETVDNFQGEESDIIILSLVRSNNREHKIGFLNISNRKCVALSRAKIGLYVIGNVEFMASCERQNNNYIPKHQSWKDIIKSAKANESISETLFVKCQMHDEIQEIKNHKDFDTKCREGGCQLKCDKDLECGHKCTRYCHGDDMDHSKTKCHQACKKHCSSNLKHPCTKECWEECGPCETKVEKILDCDHIVVDYCYIEVEKIVCPEDCKRLLECDHPCSKKCYQKCPTFCDKVIVEKLICGHWGAKQCSDDPLTVKCMTQIKKIWPLCNHNVETFCHVIPESESCLHPCNTILDDCGHTCQGTCGSCIQGLLHKPCEVKCGKQLFCGHKCEAKCFEACPPCERYCRTACAHTTCSSANVKGKKEGKVWFLNSKNAEQNLNGRKCGEACYPCLEIPCLVGCEHSKCAMKCGQECNIELCTKLCGKALRCTKKSKGKKIIELHPCIGVCGENKCLQLCPICDIDRVNTIMKDFSLDSNDKEFSFVDGKPSHAFIQLENCPHIFEVTAFDKYIKTAVSYPNDTPMEIIKIKCPKCDLPIFTSRRYNSFINKQASELENIKTLLREFSEDTNKQRKFVHEISGLTTLLKNTSVSDPTHLSKFENSLDLSLLKITPTWLLAVENCKRILSTLASYALEIDIADFSRLSHGCMTVLEECQITDCPKILKQKFNEIFDRCSCIPASNKLFEQLLSETKRFGIFVDLFLYLIQFTNDTDGDEKIDCDLLKEIVKKLTDNEKVFDDSEVWKLFEDLRDQYGVTYQSIITTKIELEKLPQKNKWFKEGERYYCI